MMRVYNRAFHRPWNHIVRPGEEFFPPVDGLLHKAPRQSSLVYSAYPSAREFDAIQWRQASASWEASPKDLGPILVAEFDIDNDGRKDLVLKSLFMVSVRPAERSVPGGMDQLHVLAPGAIDLTKPVPLDMLFGTPGENSPRMVSHMTLRYSEKDRPAELSVEQTSIGARSIRPFIFEGKTYLSLYVQLLPNDPHQRREWMWVMTYSGGGRNLGAGEWEPARMAAICRFRMALLKNKGSGEASTKFALAPPSRSASFPR